MGSFLASATALYLLFLVAIPIGAKAEQMPKLTGLSYRGIGPAIAGGRTTAVAGSDADPQFYLAGGADGGVFESRDGGSTWLPIFDKNTTAAIGAIAVAPNDESNIWVGTGESNPRNDVAMGDGIWHTINGGKAWKHLGLNDAGAISKISIDPRDNRRVIVAVLGQVFRDSPTRGIYLTADAGAHWKRVLYISPSAGASDIVRLPNDPDTLFAGLYDVRRKPWTMTSGGPNGGIFRSDDGGNTWRKLTGRGLPSPPTGRIGLAAGQKDRVYAVIQAAGGDLWRSDDGGVSWRVMPHSPLVGARRFYFSRIAVDPANPDRLISVGLELSMSTNGGRSFHRIAPNAGWDYHIVWWSGGGQRVVVGADEGVVLSLDGGATWRQPYGLPFAQAYHVGFDDNLPNYHVCIGLQDASSWCGSANSDSGLGVLNRDWWTVGPGDGMWALYDPLDSHLVWSTSTASDSGQVYLWDSRTQQAYEVSPDAEQNGGTPAYTLAHRFNWKSPIAFLPNGDALVAGNVVYESADHGQHWHIISPDLTRNNPAHQQIPGGPIDQDMSGAETYDTILSLVAPDPSTIWAGTDDGFVQLTRDGGAHWANVTPHGAPPLGRVATIEAGHFHAGTAFVAIDNHMVGDDSPHLYATSDYGSTWRSVAGDMPGNLFVRCVRQDTIDSELLYACTQRGVWASWDEGAHWHSLRLNMPATAVYDIEIQPRWDDLLVASHGRGVWILDDLHPLQQMSEHNPQTVALLPLRDTYRWWQWSPINSFEDNSLPSNIFHGPNVDYGALITYALPPHLHGKVTIDVADASGRVIRHFSGKHVPHNSGLNRMAWDLTENPPVKWYGTFTANQGPQTGAEIVPGKYTIRLHAGGVTQSQEVIVKQDPRDSLTADQMWARYRTLSSLNADLSGVDKMLNDIDKRLRAKTLTPSQRSTLIAFRRTLTFDPKNVEDLGGPPGLRDRLSDMIGRISSTSFQPPTQAQQVVAQALAQQYAQATREFQVAADPNLRRRLPVSRQPSASSRRRLESKSSPKG